MIKSMSLLTRKAGMSPQEFQRYWREVHGPIAARMPGLRRYVQSQTLLETYTGDTPPDFDGIAELYWDSLDAFEQSRATAESRAAAEDAANFIGANTRLLVTEHPLVDALPSPREREAMVKVVGMLMVKDGVTLDAFQQHWRDVHGPINVKAIPTMRRYVQAHVLPQSFGKDNPLRFGGLPEHWYDSLEAMRNRPRDPNAPRDLDWSNYCSGQKQIYTHEVVIAD